jgi:hypothetical protein
MDAEDAKRMWRMKHTMVASGSMMQGAEDRREVDAALEAKRMTDMFCAEGWM